MASRWTLSKELICPQCGDVIGWATVRRLTGWLNVELAGGGLARRASGAWARLG